MSFHPLASATGRDELFPKMPLFYAVVAKEQKVCCEYAAASGNFSSLALLILQRIPKGNSQLSYAYDTFYFHYISKDNYTYLCLSKQEFSRKVAFEFLVDLEKEFRQSYLVEVDDYSAFTPKIATLLSKYSQPDTISVLKDEVEHVRKIMSHNIGNFEF